MRISPSCLIALACAALTACGGGGSDEPSPSEKLASAEFSSAATPLPDAKPRTSSVIPQRFASFSPTASTAVFDWAQTAYPSFFPGAYIENVAYISGYGNFFYRYYEAS